MMKRRIDSLALLVLLLTLPFAAFAQVNFIEVVSAADMEAAQKKADDGMLMLFVDVYATWCGPCKMMDAQVYPDPALSTYMNEHFVSVRMDGETDFGRQYAAKQHWRDIQACIYSVMMGPGSLRWLVLSRPRKC